MPGGGGGGFFLPDGFRADSFRGTNQSALPEGIGVGYHNDVPVVCLGEYANQILCYRDQPALHRILSAFDQQDYKDDVEITQYDEEIWLSVDDVWELLPGMELRCRWSSTVEEEAREAEQPAAE